MPEDSEDEPGIHAGGHRAPDPWEERNAAFNEQTRLIAAIERIEEHYRQLARPFLDQLHRNPGVRPAGLVELEQECADRIRALETAYLRAEALEHAARQAPQQVATAHERAVERAALNALARDLPGRRHRLSAQPEPAGRVTADIAIW